ncbi:MAG: hypothetical protein KGI29_03245 [Pseudomonadota bacterium]|nr:hypothetical protein [Pseudomonadota bacterium]MDE3037004.1 hypothetical protein [Pseudomonadota bacterium]
MNHIDYFKLQAKNLFRDYKTQTSYIDERSGNSRYNYAPKFFDIGSIFFDLEWEDEENLSLMKIQHIFAKLLGFEKWADLRNASEPELELARLRFENQHKISAEDWEMYMAGVERDHKTTYDTEGRLEIFKLVFANAEHPHSYAYDYRLNRRHQH